MEQPKKPGGTRDISDLKARLGLNKGPAAPAPAGAPAARAPFPGAPPASSPFVPGSPPGGQAPFSAPAGGFPGAFPGAAPVAPPPPEPPPTHDPFAAMKPPAGKSFDLRPVDDGVPAEDIRGRGGRGLAPFVGGALLAGAILGYMAGGAAIGRRAHNSANAAARKVKGEVDEMQKTLGQIGTAVAQSQVRLGGERREVNAYDPKLIDDLEKIRLDPRPDTSRIFRTDYNRLPDLAVDRLMNYYYDTIALYGEVERHVKRTRADKASLEAFAAKTAQKTGNYGVVFDHAGKFVIANLVEVGSPVCKGGGGECGADAVEAFQIRANAGANWVSRKSSQKLELGAVVPMKPTPLMEAVMSGSPEQARMEQYRLRVNNIRAILARVTAGQKELVAQMEQAAKRGDLTTF